MSTMTNTALSDCSYPESTAYNIRDDIDATITRLKVVIDEDASLRKVLRALIVKRREEALEQVRLANLHLDLVNEEEASFCDDLMKAAASANEGLEGSGRVGSVRMGGIIMPTFVPIPTASLGNDPSLNIAEDNCRKTPIAPKTMNHGNGYDNTSLPRIPAKTRRSLDSIGAPRSPEMSTHSLFDEPPRSPARSTAAIDPPRSLARSTHAFADEPPRPPVRSTEESTKAPETMATAAKKKKSKGKRPAQTKKANLLSMPIEDLTGEPFTTNFDNNLQGPPKSPARSTHRLPVNDEDQARPPRTLARSMQGPNNTMSPKSPARYTRGLFYQPTRSPARSIYAFAPPGSPARSTYAFATEPTRTPARSARGLVEEHARSPARSTYGFAPPASPARRLCTFNRSRSPVRYRSPSVDGHSHLDNKADLGAIHEAPSYREDNHDRSHGASSTSDNRRYRNGAPSRYTESRSEDSRYYGQEVEQEDARLDRTRPERTYDPYRYPRPDSRSSENHQENKDDPISVIRSEYTEGDRYDDSRFNDQRRETRDDGILRHDYPASASSRTQSSRYGPRNDQRSYGRGLIVGEDTPSMYSQQTGQPRLLPPAVSDDPEGAPTKEFNKSEQKEEYGRV